MWKGREKIQKIEYLKNEKSFWMKYKTFFIIFKGLSFGEKINLIKKADTSFKSDLREKFFVV